MNEKELVNRLLLFESEQNLFEWKINGVNIWQYVRFGILSDARSMYFDDWKKYDEISRNYTGRMTLPIIVDKYIRRSDRFILPKDVLLIPHKRKVHIGNGLYRDSYVYYIDRYLKRSHVILDINVRDGDYVRQSARSIITFDLGGFAKRRSVTSTNQLFSKTELEKNVLHPLEEKLNILIPITVKNSWMRRICGILTSKPLYSAYYEYLLDKIKPKIILVPNGYSPDVQFLFAFARKKGIPTVELEHGMVTKEHIAYNFPENVTVEAFADYFFSFGNYEVDHARWPIRKECVIPVGFPELESGLNRFQRTKSKLCRITFISSEYRVLDDYLVQLSYLLDRRKYHIEYRLHPKEANSQKNEIAIKLAGTGVEIVTNAEKTLHECLYNADWVVGMSSTALYEATAFDTKIAILDHPFSVLSEPLYESGKAVLVKDVNDLASHIINNDFMPNEKVSFFEKNSLENIEYHIDRIIQEQSRKE